MAIKFLCPNGHPLSCPDDRAGTPGKCPKCGTQFIVPSADEIAAAASNGAAQQGEAATVASGSGVGAAKGGSGKASAAAGSGKSSAVKPGSGVGQGTAVSADQIVFLCPNGHRLNGPKSLQGKPGQCPHCGEKFRIPVYDEEPAPAQEELEEDLEEFPTEEIPEGEAIAEDDEIPVGMAVEEESAEDSEAVETFPEEFEPQDGHAVPAAKRAASIPPLPPGPSHSLFDVFSRLWPLKPNGASVAIHLKDGKTIHAARFAPALSQQACGVFAAEEDGAQRIVSIAWEFVARVEWPEQKELPPGLFQ